MHYVMNQGQHHFIGCVVNRYKVKYIGLKWKESETAEWGYEYEFVVHEAHQKGMNHILEELDVYVQGSNEHGISQAVQDQDFKTDINFSVGRRNYRVSLSDDGEVFISVSF